MFYLLWLFIVIPVHAEQLSGHSSVNIEQPISIERVNDMNFGVILPDQAADRVIMAKSAGGGRTSANGRSRFSGDFSQGKYLITGIPKAVCSINIDTNTVLTGPGSDISLSALGASNTNITLKGNGSAIFYVGGDLNINENQAAGIYSGEFFITVEYQ